MFPVYACALGVACWGMLALLVLFGCTATFRFEPANMRAAGPHLEPGAHVDVLLKPVDGSKVRTVWQHATVAVIDGDAVVVRASKRGVKDLQEAAAAGELSLALRSD
jgi:hypothetical protein